MENNDLSDLGQQIDEINENDDLYDLQQMNENNDKEESLLISLFDLEQQINKNKNVDENIFPQERWIEYMNFTKNLNQEINNNRQKTIEAFINNFNTEKNLKIIEQSIDWIDLKELERVQKEFKEGLKDKDKSLSCFRDLKLYKKPLKIKNFKEFDILDKELPNFKEVTKYYRGAFALNQSRNLKKYEAPRPVLLLGNPGIGKTHYAKKLATILGTNFSFLDANSIHGGWILTGNNSTWRGADAGLIFKEMVKSDTISPIILLDEIDKLQEGNTESPFSALHQLLEKENAKSFYDEHVSLKFNASQIIYILTANDAHNIPQSLLSRMNVFNIENPDEESMKGIVKTIYKSLLSESTLFKPTLAKKEIDKLTQLSPREVTQIISKNLFAQASEAIKTKNKNPRSLIIDSLMYKKKEIGFQ